VCEEMNAREVGRNPVTKPFNKRRMKNTSTELTKPMKKTDVAIPKQLINKIGLKPKRSANRPQIGDMMSAVINVAPKINPAHFCTYSSEWLPNVSIYSERKGMIM